jgi:hypothetical protein
VASACSNPCEEAVKKTISCAQGEGLKSSLRAERELAVKVCRPHEDRVKECVGVADCTEFHRCMKKAVVFRENAPTRQSLPGGAEAPPEAAPVDMTAVPD